MAGSPWTKQIVSLIILTEETGGFSGMFGYSPAPGAGNLIFSLSAVAGTDEYGNTYPQGLSVGAGAGPQIILMPIDNAAAVIQFPMTTPALSQPATITSEIANSVNEFSALVISGPAVAIGGEQDYVSLTMWGDPGNGEGAHMDFGWSDSLDGGSDIIIATMNSSGFMFNGPIVVDETSTASPTPAGGCALYYYGGQLWALGQSGIPVALATT